MDSDNYKKITQVIDYLVCQYKDGLPKLKLVKLVWAADRYHIRKYSRSVTGDDYFAMKNGPVASCVKDIVEFSINEYSNLSEDNLPYIKKFIKNENGVIYSVSKPVEDYLSETDIEALEFALSNFGNMTDTELVEFTHKYPEWLKPSKDLEPPIGNGTRKSKDIAERDFYKNPGDEIDDPFVMDNKELENSKKIFLEFA